MIVPLVVRWTSNVLKKPVESDETVKTQKKIHKIIQNAF